MYNLDYISSATIERMAVYNAAIAPFADWEIVRSIDLARITNCQPAQIRKDFTFFDCVGNRGSGYQISRLRPFLAGLLANPTVKQIIFDGIANRETEIAMMKEGLNA